MSAPMNIWEWPDEEFLDPTLDPEQSEILATLTSLCRDGVTGTRILEPGAGTGRVGYHLHRMGAHVVLSDLSPNSISGSCLRFAAGGSRPLGIVRADLLSLPFADQSFDLVWNSGVMEHFAPEALVRGLREMGRVSARLVAVFVPHLFCVPYNVARLLAVDTGAWRWGYEDPKRTLRGAFTEAGLEVIDEFDFGHDTSIPMSYLPLLPQPMAEAFRHDFVRSGRWPNGVSLATVGIAKH